MRALFILLLFLFCHPAEVSAHEGNGSSIHHHFDQQSDDSVDYMLCDDSADDDFELVKKYPAPMLFVHQPFLILRDQCAYEATHEHAQTTRSVLTRICVLRI
jgi:hypothetical protein